MCQNFLPYKAESYSKVCLPCILLIHSSVNRCLACVHVLALADNAALNMGVQIFLPDPAFGSLMALLFGAQFAG